MATVAAGSLNDHCLVHVVVCTLHNLMFFFTVVACTLYTVVCGVHTSYDVRRCCLLSERASAADGDAGRAAAAGGRAAHAVPRLQRHRPQGQGGRLGARREGRHRAAACETRAQTRAAAAKTRRYAHVVVTSVFKC